MGFLVIGLVVFLGLHSLRIFGENGRAAMISRFGENGFKLAYSVLSLAGLVLMVHGYGEARFSGTQLYVPPASLRHVTMLLVPVAFVLVTSAYLPTGHIKAAVAHPMILGVALWALGHLLANGSLADTLLFGGFLVWGIADYLAAYRRTGGAPAPLPGPARAGRGMIASAPSRSFASDAIAVAIGLAATAVFLGGLHVWLFGVSPLG